ncbi:hypothetical protein JXD38_04280 [candidate division WOR-3 bacterium]|nr:hypothetical protein [candidate division WOR-3 bacterium]
MARKNIEGLWDDVRLWMTDATKTALKEAEDLTRRGRLKMDLVRLSRELEKKMADLGVKVYGRYSKAPDAPITVDEELKALMRDIAKIQADVEKSQQEYEAEKKA